jgi:hypothetical protein
MSARWDQQRKPSKLRTLIPLLRQVKEAVEAEAERSAATAKQLAEQAVREGMSSHE